MERLRPYDWSRVAACRRNVAKMALALSAGLACFGTSALHAAPASVGAGYTYYSGPAGQITRSAIVFGSVSPMPGFQATLGGMRYDDNGIGEGNGLIGGLGMPLAPLTTFRVWGYRYLGDEDFKAWRVKVGPELGLPRSATLGLFYSHYQADGDADGATDAAIGELGIPLVAGLTARMNASYASAANDVASTQGSLGLAWSPMRLLELSSEIGVAHNGWTTAPFPSRGTPGLPLIGGGGGSPGSENDESSTESTFQIGATVSFP